MKVLYGAFALLVFIYLAYTVYAAIGAWMCAQVEKEKSRNLCQGYGSR